MVGLGTFALSTPRAVDSMPVPSGAPALLLGRERDIAELEEALGLAAQGIPQIMLIGGDAGIGKTTLVADLERRAGQLGFTVATGHGLDIEAGISFAPVVEAVRSLLGGLEDLSSRPSGRRMLSLLDPSAPRSREALHVLDDLTAAVLEAAAAGPVLLVLEDMHWADRSTQDFAAALSATARGGLLLVLTHRSDELHRRHPFRKTLAEISRTPGARRVDLGPLGRDDIAGIVAAHTDGPPDPSVVGAVLARSEGNPLYAEELLAGDRADDQEGVPHHLSDLLLARIDALEEGPRELLRLASVYGTRLDTETLAELAGLDRTRTEELLREALDANVLRQTRGHLEFRHPLLREAAYDDLMPDERTRTHARLAEILQARVDSDPDPRLDALSRLAFHWNAAHDLPRTLAASVQAGLTAARLGAAEQVTHLERALSLWDRVPDPEVVAGLRQIELVVLLGESADYTDDSERRYGLARRAVDMLEADTDPLLASLAYSALAGCVLFHEDPVGAEESARRAVAYAGDAPSEELARALLASATQHNFSDRLALSLAAAERAHDVAEAIGRTDLMLSADEWRANNLYHLGRVTEALAAREHAVAAYRRAGLIVHAVGATEHLAWLCAVAGQVDRCLTLASAGIDEARALGLAQQAAACGDPAVEALIWLGRLDEAAEQLETLRGLGLVDGRDRRLQSQLLLARGEARAARPLLQEEAAHLAGSSRHPEDIEVLRQLRLAAMLNDQTASLVVASSYLTQLEDCDSALVAGAAARIGFQALTLLTSTTGARVDDLRDRAGQQLEGARAGLTDEWRPTYCGVQLALAEAYAARYAGEPAVDQFREATVLAEPFGVYFALEPRLDLAIELLAHGGRDEGRELLVECWSTAHDIGAHDLERRASELATRTRVPLPHSGSTGGPLSRLTPREREVLDLLATGATNKAIAGSLFITEKTASVHVSNLLAKLDVANRGEAAALARDLVG